jgi:aminoglycoside phosphotransferase (APT) family kinase protein
MVLSSLPGLELPKLTEWMDSELPGLREGTLMAQPISGGFSNLTYRVSDGVSDWVLRRPPLGHVLPSAHDMAREYRIISALAPTDVPVATPLAFCADQDVIGARFYLMSYVEGRVVDEHSLPASATTAKLTEIYDRMIDALVLIHKVDPDQVGLADLGRPDGFLERQVNRWRTQWEASQTRPLVDVDLAVDLLLAGLPERSVATIVHGDYRIGNLLFSPAGDTVAAVVDWEMATLGDPLADLGLLVAYHEQATDDRVPPTDHLTTRYAAALGVDVSDIAWFVGLAHFKLAVISEGIHHRHLAGQTVGEGFDQIGETVPSLLASAVGALQRK